jgi:ABC-type transport system involved in cytochrome bd biosynthesis fused ATPase/permease subunit
MVLLLLPHLQPLFLRMVLVMSMALVVLVVTAVVIAFLETAVVVAATVAVAAGAPVVSLASVAEGSPPKCLQRSTGATVHSKLRSSVARTHWSLQQCTQCTTAV